MIKFNNGFVIFDFAYFWIGDINNLWFYNMMLHNIRLAIHEGRYREYKKERLERLEEGEKERKQQQSLRRR